MRISDWSSDVCSSDLRSRRCGGTAGSCSPTPSMARRSAAALPTSSPPTFNGSRNNGRRNKGLDPRRHGGARRERAGGRLLCQPRRSEEHTSELQSLMRISYAVFCLKKKTHLERPCIHTDGS